MKRASLLLPVLVSGCGSLSVPSFDAPSAIDARIPVDAAPAPIDGPPTPDVPVITPDAPPAAPDAPPGTPDAQMFTLNITNYINWCTILEDGVAYSTSKTFPAGHMVMLQGAPIGGFVWGYWTGTDGDMTPAHDTAQNTMVTMTANKDVLACCPAPPPASQTCP